MRMNWCLVGLVAVLVATTLVEKVAGLCWGLNAAVNVPEGYLPVSSTYLFEDCKGPLNDAWTNVYIHYIPASGTSGSCDWVTMYLNNNVDRTFSNCNAQNQRTGQILNYVAKLSEFRSKSVPYDCGGGWLHLYCVGTIRVYLTDDGPCPVGQYRSAAATHYSDKQCAGCPAQYYCHNGWSYYRCPGGQEPNAQRTGCQQCGPGTFSLGPQCLPCPYGQYQDRWGQSSCAYCPPGTQPNVAKTGCDVCPTGTYKAVAHANGGWCSGCNFGLTCDYFTKFATCVPSQDTTCTSCNAVSRPSTSFDLRPYPMSFTHESLNVLAPLNPAKTKFECFLECKNDANCAGFVSKAGLCTNYIGFPFFRSIVAARSPWTRDPNDKDETQIYRKFDATRETRSSGMIDTNINDCTINQCQQDGTIYNACAAMTECVCKDGFLGKQCDVTIAGNSELAMCEALGAEISAQIKDFGVSCPCGMERTGSDCLPVVDISEKRIQLGLQSLRCLQHYQQTSVLKSNVLVGSKFRSLGKGTSCFPSNSGFEVVQEEDESRCRQAAVNRGAVAFEFSTNGGCKIASSESGTVAPILVADQGSSCFVIGFRNGPDGTSPVTTHPYANIFANLAKDCAATYEQIPFDNNQTNHQARAELALSLDGQSPLAFFFSSYLEGNGDICDIVCPCGKYPINSNDVNCQGTIQSSHEGVDHARAMSKCAWKIDWTNEISRYRGSTYMLQVTNCLSEYVMASTIGVRDPFVANAVEEISNGVTETRTQLKTHNHDTSLLDRWEGIKVDLAYSNGNRQALPTDLPLRDITDMAQDVSALADAADEAQVVLDNPSSIPFENIRNELIVDLANIDIRTNKIISDIADDFTDQDVEAFLPDLAIALTNMNDNRQPVEEQVDLFVSEFVVAIFPDREIDRIHMIFGAIFAVADMYNEAASLTIETVQKLTDGEFSELNVYPVTAALSTLPLAQYAQLFRDWASVVPGFGIVAEKVDVLSEALFNLTILESRGFKDVLTDIGQDYEGFKQTIFDLSKLSLQAIVAHVQTVKLMLDPTKDHKVPWLDTSALGHLWDMFRYQTTGLLTSGLTLCPLPGNKEHENSKVQSVTDGNDRRRRLLHLSSSEQQLSTHRVSRRSLQGGGGDGGETDPVGEEEDDDEIMTREKFDEIMRQPCGRLNNAVIEFALRASQIQSGMVQQVWKIQSQFRQGSVVASQNHFVYWLYHLDDIAAIDSISYSRHAGSLLADRLIQTESALFRYLGKICQAAKYLLPHQDFDAVDSQLAFDQDSCQFSHPKKPIAVSTGVKQFTIEFVFEVPGKDCSLNLCEVEVFAENNVRVPIVSYDQDREIINAGLAFDGSPTTCTNAARNLKFVVELSDIRKLTKIVVKGDPNGDGWTSKVNIRANDVFLASLAPSCAKSSCTISSFAPISFDPSNIETHGVRFGRIQQTMEQIIDSWLPKITDAISKRTYKDVGSCTTGAFSKPLEFRGDNKVVDVVYGSFGSCLNNADVHSAHILLRDRDGNVVPPPGTSPVLVSLSLLKPAMFYRYVESGTESKIVENSFILPNPDIKFEFEYRTINAGGSCQPGETKLEEPGVNTSVTHICYSRKTTLSDTRMILPSPMTSWLVTLESFYPENVPKPFKASLRFFLTGSQCVGSPEDQSVLFSKQRRFFNTPGSTSETILFGGHVCGGRAFDVKYVAPLTNPSPSSPDDGSNQWVVPLAAGLAATLVIGAAGLYVYKKRSSMKAMTSELRSSQKFDDEPPVGTVLGEDNPMFQKP